MNPKKMLIGLALLALAIVPTAMAIYYHIPRTFQVTSSIPSQLVLQVSPLSIDTTFTERGTGGPSIKINHNFSGSDHVSGSLTQGSSTTTYSPEGAYTSVYVRRDINDCTGTVTVNYYVN
jgi:hypothetical protein